jgi:hypothetical protein
MFFEFIGYKLKSIMYVKNKINKKNFLFVNIIHSFLPRFVIPAKKKYSYFFVEYYINF